MIRARLRESPRLGVHPAEFGARGRRRPRGPRRLPICLPRFEPTRILLLSPGGPDASELQARPRGGPAKPESEGRGSGDRPRHGGSWARFERSGLRDPPRLRDALASRRYASLVFMSPPCKAILQADEERRHGFLGGRRRVRVAAGGLPPRRIRAGDSPASANSRASRVRPFDRRVPAARYRLTSTWRSYSGMLFAGQALGGARPKVRPRSYTLRVYAHPLREEESDLSFLDFSAPAGGPKRHPRGTNDSARPQKDEAPSRAPLSGSRRRGSDFLARPARLERATLSSAS